MARFRFLHAADIHLDSPLVGLSRYEGLPLDRVRRATRDAFDSLVSFAIREEVAFVVIAGDLFDGDWKDMATGLYFVGAMGRLARADIPVFLLKGNHDADSVVTKSLPLPSNVHVFDSRKPQTFEIARLKVALHGRSFPEAHVRHDLAGAYPRPLKGRFNIGVLHTALEGYAEHAPYAPCTLASLQAKGYDYWALGHVHERQVLARDPWVVFCGNLQGRHSRETGPKGATLVEVAEGGAVEVRHEALDVLRWSVAEARLDGVADEAGVRDAIGRALRAAREDVPGDRPLVARVVLTGRTPLANTLANRRDRLRDEACALAAALDEVFIEKVLIRTEPPVREDRASLDEAGRMIEDALGDPQLREALATALRPFLDATPGEACEEGGLHQAARAGEWDQVLKAASLTLAEQLKAGSA
jgi:DNA repair exonuclease SbcCD nuclease subunit